mmetsp:Transcript_7059/g.20760  ORF Transcript_7059/g.20760 Transcript_7059/m.20760 type:complete len:173 (+) Transcript_7059:142-660(+)|eukprot:CAMPEP_0119260868 /NCGR_PEP_ID=MMETSP1329-20130426/1103_1 /TAXON_ID=114041 /ORGANISM="Genus nov. species nov., Strain RCC1024" /LENGTH=172 /DNA_ID=CAMNT_0007260337 /DNA_START=123 /DNA_END=641 /DNA_ORIENTATION=+
MGATDDLKGALFASVGCLVGMLAVHEANKAVGARGYSYKVGCPPTGPLACLLFCMPKAPASSPKTVLMSHALATVSALAAGMLYDALPVAADIVPKNMCALVLCILGMMSLKCLNPPAAALAAAMTAASPTLETVLLGPGMLGALVLIAVQQVYFALAGLVTKNPVPKAKKA